jgi:hypothetical protein
MAGWLRGCSGRACVAPRALTHCAAGRDNSWWRLGASGGDGAGGKRGAGVGHWGVGVGADCRLPDDLLNGGGVAACEQQRGRHVSSGLHGLWLEGLMWPTPNRPTHHPPTPPAHLASGVQLLDLAGTQRQVEGAGAQGGGGGPEHLARAVRQHHAPGLGHAKQVGRLAVWRVAQRPHHGARCHIDQSHACSGRAGVCAVCLGWGLRDQVGNRAGRHVPGLGGGLRHPPPGCLMPAQPGHLALPPLERQGKACPELGPYQGRACC